MIWWHLITYVNGRAGPSATAAILHNGQPGEDILVQEEVVGGGRTWLHTDKDLYYAKEFCRVGQNPPKPTTPVPGSHITTPWRRRSCRLWPTRCYHTGIDWAGVPRGSDVIAVRDGRVTALQDDFLGNVALLYWTSKLGNKFTSWHCHLNTRPTEQDVRAGEAIGKIGDTGHAFGVHLHWELRRGWTKSWSGIDLNPLRALP